MIITVTQESNGNRCKFGIFDTVQEAARFSCYLLRGVRKEMWHTFKIEVYHFPAIQVYGLEEFYEKAVNGEIIMRNCKAEKLAEHVTRYTFDEPTKSGGQLIVDITECEDSGGHSLPWLWKKNGYTKTRLATYLFAETYAYDGQGGCWGRYNPMIKNEKLDFDWVLENTEENKARLLTEIIRRAYEEK